MPKPDFARFRRRHAPLLARSAAAAAMLLGCGPAIADDAAADDGAKPAWTFGGFGTAGAVHSNESQADFTTNPVKSGGVGHGRSWSADVDSRLGVQLGLAFSPRWSAVLQLVSERGLQDSWRPALEWANVKYRATPDLSVRLGRVALPLFLAGDYLKAAYALPWVRPPVELYGAIPISYSDGVDASYRWSGGGLNNVTQAQFGHAEIKFSEQSRASARGLASVSNTTTAGALTLRVSILTTKLSCNLAQSLFDGLRQFGAQ
ncbi:MAG TPA: hypothetical protein VGP06_16735, partial [Janthinobacterium sp.]|nr:hypothetical protein [Janthinobacterium sp.]